MSKVTKGMSQLSAQIPGAMLVALRALAITNGRPLSRELQNAIERHLAAPPVIVEPPLPDAAPVEQCSTPAATVAAPALPCKGKVKPARPLVAGYAQVTPEMNTSPASRFPRRPDDPAAIREREATIAPPAGPNPAEAKPGALAGQAARLALARSVMKLAAQEPAREPDTPAALADYE